MNHLALAVADEERSRRFYATHFGFDARTEQMDDGVLMLWNADGFQLALGPADPEAHLPAFLHFGVRLGSGDAVRARAAELTAQGVTPLDAYDEADYVSRKFRDPDGYVVEIFWEP